MAECRFYGEWNDVDDQLSRATADERNCLTVTAEAFADIAQRIRRACGEEKA